MRYLAFIESLRRAAAYPTSIEGKESSNAISGFNIITQPVRMGFAAAIRRGMEVIETEYVLIVPHDQRLTREIDFPKVIGCLNERKVVKYIGFPTQKRLKYLRVASASNCQIHAKHRCIVTATSRSAQCSLGLMRYILRELNHIALVLSHPRTRQRGVFIEDSWGQYQLQELKTECQRSGQRCLPSYAQFQIWNLCIF